MGAEDQHLEPVGAGLEGACYARADPNSVERGQLYQFVVELDPARPGQDNVDLFRDSVAVGEGFTLGRLYPQEVDTGLLGAEIGSREAGLLRLREPELDRAVLDRTKIRLRVPYDLAILRSLGRL